MKTVKGNVLTILGIVAAIVAVIGVNAEKEHEDTERMRKLNRIPAHTNKWRDAR